MIPGPRLWSLLVLLGLLTSVASSAEPTIRNLNVRGLQAAGATTLILDGEDLGKTPRLLLPFAAKQTLKPGSTERQATFDVALEDVAAGYYHLRVVTEGGVSLPVVIAVDRIPHKTIATTAEALPVSFHGTVSGSNSTEMKFVGKAGQKVVVEVEAQRLGSKLRPIIHLYNARRLQLAWAWGIPSLSGDARLEAALGEDGEYTVSVHDAEYAPPAPSYFRLKAGSFSFVDQVFPPVVGKGKQMLELLGPATPPRMEVNPMQAGNILPLDWPREGLWSGPRPFVAVATQAEVVENADSARGQEVPAGLIGVSGRLSTAFEEDRYRVPVRAGSRLRFEVHAERMGSPVDVALVLRNESGGELARSEDLPNTLDAALDYSVPDRVTTVLACVLDAQGRGGSKAIYRLTVTPQGAGPDRGDFQLQTPARRVTLPVDGKQVIPVLVNRQGYQGSITLSAAGLPAGVKIDNAVIPAEATGTLVILSRGVGTADPVITTWRGKAEDGQERTVQLSGHPLERLQPWLASELALAPTVSKAADFSIDWRGLPADAGLAPAAKLALPVKLTRTDTTSPVRLSLVTSQLPILANNQPDPNRTLRVERPVELAAKITEGELSVLVPAQLDAPVYDVTVQAELLSPDRQRVLATAHAPVRRMVVRFPVALRLEGPPRLEAKSDPKANLTVEIKGKVERREGFPGDVALTLTGLPAGTRADPATVKAGTDSFSLKLILPPGAPPGEFRGLKLGWNAADPKQPNVRVRGRDIDLTLIVHPANK